MKFDLNNEQSKLLANFLSDLGKGFFLGAFGIATLSENRIELITFSVFFTMICVFGGLYLLNESK